MEARHTQNHQETFQLGISWAMVAAMLYRRSQRKKFLLKCTKTTAVHVKLQTLNGPKISAKPPEVKQKKG